MTLRGTNRKVSAGCMGREKNGAQLNWGMIKVNVSKSASCGGRMCVCVCVRVCMPGRRQCSAGFVGHRTMKHN
eukprot:1032480-Pelagomonas_calceolata.AAC.2